MYRAIDGMAMDGLLDGLTDDVEVTFGNCPSMKGKAAVEDGVGAFWKSIRGLTHHFVNVVESGACSALEATVDYVRADGRLVTIPCVTMLMREGELVRSLRIYIDIGPVYEPIDTIVAPERLPQAVA
ncbi:nuclear transport factor 2 family protein [Variovorax sp. J31P207]|uniref:nuclear transport factor 2 family protein n=1 Tax=Variovorax sp. J31P207 TaxID=3053510 RepID=UPI002574CB52|nr:nuclear transport factor 2 family protein [Variovorax sp. J31P207]MDM0066939.1 nuclear transport factor 2 family protein [Variovorax sp. J31P207]